MIDLIDLVEQIHVRSVVEVINGKANNAPKIIIGEDIYDVLERTKKCFAESIQNVAGGGISKEEIDAAWHKGCWDYFEGYPTYVKVNDPVIYAE